MAKAMVTTRDGISIKLDGTAEEIASVVRRIRTGEGRTAKGGTQLKPSARPQLVDLIHSLIDGGFFSKPKDLASIKAGLAQMGHHYPLSTLSGAMLRQVRGRNLRRQKQDNRWFYTR